MGLELGRAAGPGAVGVVVEAMEPGPDVSIGFKGWGLDGGVDDGGKREWFHAGAMDLAGTRWC